MTSLWSWAAAVAGVAVAGYFMSTGVAFKSTEGAQSSAGAAPGPMERPASPGTDREQINERDQEQEQEQLAVPVATGAELRHPQLEEEADSDVEMGFDWENDPRPAQALAARQAAQEPQKINKWKTREVGKKKAKSLARKEQRKQWFEYVRERANEDRERDRLEREMYGDLLAEEQQEQQERIEAARQAIEERRRLRRAQEEKDRAAREARRAELKQELATNGRAKLHSEDDLVLADDLGIIVADGRWVVTVTDDIVDRLASAINGRTSFAELASALG